MDKFMDIVGKVLIWIAILYFVLQLGRAWGRSEIVKDEVKSEVSFLDQSRVNKYNEIMLRNCLRELNK